MKNECRYYKREVYKYWCKMQSSFDSNQLIIPVIWPSSTSFPLATVINYFPDRRRCEATGSSLVRIFRKVASAYEKGLLAPKTSKDEDDVITSGLRPPSPTRVDHADELKDADEIFTSGLRPPSPTKVDQFENITRKSKSNGSQEKGSSGLRPPSPTKVDHAENLNQNPKSDSGLEGYSSPKHKKTSSLFGMFRGLATAFKKGILSPRKGGRNGSKILSDTKAPPSSRYGNVTIPSIASPTEIETSPKIETAPSNRPANIATLNVTNPPTQFEEKNLKDKKSASQITTEDDDLDDTWSEDRLRNALKAAAQLRNQNRESITLRNSITNFLSDGAGFLDTVLLGKSDEEVDDLNATMDSICSAGLSGTLSSIGSKKKSLAALALEQGDTGENKGDKENEHDSRNCGIRFSVWAHSMGNWLLYNLVTELLEKELQHEVCRFKKLIMTAPNVPPNMLDGHSIHYKKAGRKLCGIFDSIYSVYSLRDPALLINPHKNQNMGLKGPINHDPHKVHAINFSWIEKDPSWKEFHGYYTNPNMLRFAYVQISCHGSNKVVWPILQGPNKDEKYNLIEEPIQLCGLAGQPQQAMMRYVSAPTENNDVTGKKANGKASINCHRVENTEKDSHESGMLGLIGSYNANTM